MNGHPRGRVKSVDTELNDSVTRYNGKICFIGAGYVGSTTSAVLAYHNPSANFTVVDKNVARIAAWNSNKPPIYEPGLEELLNQVQDRESTANCDQSSQTISTKQNGVTEEIHGPKKISPRRVRNLAFSSRVRESINSADVIFVAVNTPQMCMNGVSTSEPDLSFFNAAIQMIGEIATTPKIIVQKSTVPCGTAKKAALHLSSIAKPGASFKVLSNPEFLAQGTALANLQKPDSVIIGSEHGCTDAVAVLRSFYETWIPADRIVEMSLASAELAKIACNALLAQRISSINALGMLCEVVGADASALAEVCSMDSRIGPTKFEAGPGFGGSCLRKDTLGLAHFATSLGLSKVGSFWREVIELNDLQGARIAERVISRFGLDASKNRVAILGFAYKKGTGDPRGSITRTLTEYFVESGATVALHDTRIADRKILDHLFLKTQELYGRVEICSTGYHACEAANFVIIMVEDEEYIGMNWSQIAGAMKDPKYLLDTRNCLDDTKLGMAGLSVERVGRCPQYSSVGEDNFRFGTDIAGEL